MEEFQKVLTDSVKGVRGDVTDALLDVIHIGALTNNPDSMAELGPVVAQGSPAAIQRALDAREARGEAIFRGGQNPGVVHKEQLVASLQEFRKKMKPTLRKHLRGLKHVVNQQCYV